MTKAQMPEGSSSGQCDPVTGDTLHSPNSPAMPMRMISPSSSSTAYDNTHCLPLSPPSTPSTSPREETLSISWTSRDGTSALPTYKDQAIERDESRLREALSSIAVNDKADLPETPESTPLTMSPADMMIRHQPSISARDFVQSVLPRLRAIGHGGRRYLVEDAGMELVCPGWSGAVLVDSRAVPTKTQSRSYSSSISSSKMSRTPSISSLKGNPPRRILLTKIAAAQLDTKDLRSSILDALDHATEKLQVENVVFVLDRTGVEEEKFRAMLHGLCYVGANVVGHGAHGEEKPRQQNQGQKSDQEEDVHSPKHVAPGLVLLSVDV